MATHHGNEGAVYIGANQVAEIQDFNIEETIDQVDDSSMGDSWKGYLTGLKDWSGSITCWWDETDTNGQEAMTIGASVTLNIYPEGNSSGDQYATMTAIIQSVGVSSSKDGIVTRTFNVIPGDSSGITWGAVTP